MILHGLNGLGCLALTSIPFLVMGGVAWRNVLRERKEQDLVPPLPRYGRRWHVTRVTHGAQVPREASEMPVDA